MSSAIEVPFHPNDHDSRISFLQETVFEAFERLRADQEPAWGRMTPQQMVEHLAWTFQISTGQIVVECAVPEERRDQAKPYIFNDQPSPKNFTLPPHRAGLPPLQCPDLSASIQWLRTEIARFLEQFRHDPTALHTHPVLGPVASEEWSRLHFKHCYHHLAQFSLVCEPAQQ